MEALTFCVCADGEPWTARDVERALWAHAVAIKPKTPGTCKAGDAASKAAAPAALTSAGSKRRKVSK